MRPMSRLPLAVATILSLVGTGLTWNIYRIEVTAQQAAFDVLAQRTARRVEIRIRQHIALLTATRAFLETHPGSRKREVFAAFVAGLDLQGQYAGLQGIGLAQLLPPATDDSIEASLRNNYGAFVEVWPDPVPGLRTAIVLLEPHDARNHAALGFNMSTEAHRRRAMLQAPVRLSRIREALQKNAVTPGPDRRRPARRAAGGPPAMPEQPDPRGVASSGEGRAAGQG